jgi:hypothetical protein
MLIGTFAHAGLSAAPVEQLRRHACEVYHRYQVPFQAGVFGVPGLDLPHIAHR